jgi:hypothetical protein
MENILESKYMGNEKMFKLAYDEESSNLVQTTTTTGQYNEGVYDSFIAEKDVLLKYMT